MAQRDQDSGLLSPAPSETSISWHTGLPIPRTHPLVAGSAKETSLLNYLDTKVTHITGRYAKSFAATTSDHGPNSGYTNFDQVIQDINPLVDVVWITSTPSIEIPYLLTLAGHFSDFMSAFPFTVSSLRMARKFDLAFSTLLTTSDSSSYHINPTDKVRIRSLVEESKVMMINVASKEGHRVVEGDDEDDDMTTDTEYSPDAPTNSLSAQAVAIELGKVYERTIEILGGDISSLPPSLPKPTSLPPAFADDVEVINL